MWQYLPRFITNAVICGRAQLHKFSPDRYVIRRAQSVAEYEDAFKLLHVGYVYQGIENVRGAAMRITPQHVLPETVVLVAYEGDVLVGTMSVTPDSPAGLPLDKDYPAELAKLRLRCTKLAEYGSLAVTQSRWHTGVTTLMNVAAHRIAAQVFEASHAVVGINPKAAPFFRAAFDFEAFARPQHHAELAAPVVGMVQNLNTMLAYFARHHPHLTPTGHPLVRHLIDEPLSCIELPARLSPANLNEWRMPRAIFQELFLKKSQRLETLEPAVRQYLEKQRSRATLEQPTLGAQCQRMLVA